jgi:hypothetical protein
METEWKSTTCVEALAAAGTNLLADDGRERRKEAEGEGGCGLRAGENGRGCGD